MKLTDLPHVIGVAPNAFSRVVPASFLENYTVICLKKRDETQYAKKDAKVIVAEEEFPEESKLVKQSTKAILEIPGVVDYINSFPNPYILIYKAMPELEKYTQKMGWNLIANKFELREKLENKKNFREVLIKSGAIAIEGEIIETSKFVGSFHKELKEKFGEKLVFQISEMTGGGGLGTFFINNETDYAKFLVNLKDLIEKKPEIEHVNVTRFIDGIPASIISIATPKGTITGTLQAQIQDVDLVNDPSKGSGLYCGHDWQFLSGRDEIIKNAKEIAKSFGDFISKELGYRGLFGMDVLVDIETNKVYPVECNPRYTDLFPIISMNCLDSGITPFDYYHILSFVNPDLIGDTEEVSASYKYLNPASQLVLSTKSNKRTRMRGEIKAGIYKFDETGQFTFDRGGYRFEEIKDDNEFLITEGVPVGKVEFSPQSRIARLVFQVGILESKNKLKPLYEEIIKNIYKMVDLEEIS